MASLFRAAFRKRAAAIRIDPFGFSPGCASRIAGLAPGTEPSPDPAYAFHTPYVHCGDGAAQFELRFEGLTATRGTLTLRVHAHDGAPESPIELAGMRQVSLRDQARRGRAITLDATADPGKVYAIVGLIHDDTDAAATALAITIARSAADAHYRRQLATARSCVFAPPAPAPIADLISRDRATLADPVSQMCTLGQMEEPVYAEWAGRLGRPVLTHRKQWEFVYILQALRHHGMLRPGARGLGFGCGKEPLPAAMAAMGCTVVATDLGEEEARAAGWTASDQHGASIDSLRHPAICPDPLFDQRVSFRVADMNRIPGDLAGFDFTWSSCAFEHLGSIEAGLRFFEDSVRCLRPGGVAVHTTELNLTSNAETLETGATVLFRRRDIERLALRLRSAGHEVAPITFDPGDRPLDAHVDAPPYGSDLHLKVAISRYVTTSFGMIARRGPG